MPLLLAPLVALSIGILLGARRAGSLGATGLGVANRCVALLAALGFFPALSFAALYRPAWSLLHVTDAGRIPSFAILLGAAAVSGLLMAGQRAGQIIAARPGGSATLVGAIPGVVAAVLAAGMHHRWRVLEPSRRATEAMPFIGSRFAVGLMLIDLLLVLAIWLTVRAIDGIDEPSNRARPAGGSWLNPRASSRQPTTDAT